MVSAGKKYLSRLLIILVGCARRRNVEVESYISRKSAFTDNVSVRSRKGDFPVFFFFVGPSTISRVLRSGIDELILIFSARILSIIRNAGKMVELKIPYDRRE